MSGQEKTSTQAGEPIRAPRHFPGFDGNWARKELRPYLVRHLERVPADTDLRIYSSSREGLLPQDEYYGGHNRINDGEYGVVPEGHFVYRHMSDDTTFKFNVNNAGQPIAVSKEYPVFTTDGVDSTFLKYLLNESYPFKQFAAMQRKGGTRTRLYFEALCSWRAPLPSLPEQERIAECLASIDALIEAENEKLEALKEHKKGLMQQFFPAEGETLPARRFPDFQGSVDWKIRPLGELCDILNNRRQPISKTNRRDGPYPYYGASGIVDFIDEYAFDERLILLGEDGAKWGAFERTAFIVEGKYWVNNHAHVLKPIGVDDAFLESYLVFLDLGPIATGAAPPKLTLAKLKEIPVPVPLHPKEQELIGQSLTSVGDLIDRQFQRLEELQKHKIGLIQKLFPVLDEVEG